MPSGRLGCTVAVLANWVTSNQCLGAAGAASASGTGGTREIKLALHVSRTHDNHLHREIRSQMNGTPLSPERVACRFSSQYLAWREYDARPLRLHYRNYPAPFSMLFQRKREDVPRRIEPENGIPHVRILSAYSNQMTRVEWLFGMPSLRGWCESAGSSASCRPQNRLSDSTSHARPRIQIQIEPLCVVPRDSPITRDNKIRSRRNASPREKKRCGYDRQRYAPHCRRAGTGYARSTSFPVTMWTRKIGIYRFQPALRYLFHSSLNRLSNARSRRAWAFFHD